MCGDPEPRPAPGARVASEVLGGSPASRRPPPDPWEGCPCPAGLLCASSLGASPVLSPRFCTRFLLPAWPWPRARRGTWRGRGH